MCIWDSYVYQRGVLCFLIDECYIRSVKRYCFVRKNAAVPVQLAIVILQYTTGHVIHQQFNIQQLYIQPTLYLCVLYLSENKQRLVPLTA